MTRKLLVAGLIAGLIVFAILLPLALPVAVVVLAVSLVFVGVVRFGDAQARSLALPALDLSRAPPSR